MSTRKLIIAALVCGVVILVAGAFQLVQIAHNHSSPARPPVVTTSR